MVIDSGDPNGAAVLSACHYAPDAFRTAGEDLVVVSWGVRRGDATPLRSETRPREVECRRQRGGRQMRRRSRALVDGYRAEARDVALGELDLGIFSADISVVLNWTATRIHHRL